jgi:hypothetical protein
MQPLVQAVFSGVSIRFIQQIVQFGAHFMSMRHVYLCIVAAVTAELTVQEGVSRPWSHASSKS